MPIILPQARLGVILSSGNWPVETYFRAYAPPTLGIHVSRMRMGSGGERAPADMEQDALNAAALVADVGADLIDLQATGIVMERGPAGEAELVTAVTRVTGIPTYTASQAVVEALRVLGIQRLVLIGPYGGAPIGRESAYLEASGFDVIDAAGLVQGARSAAIPPQDWVLAATSRDHHDVDGIFLSGSNSRMLEAIVPIEQALGKPVITSIQAALWAATRRLAAKIGDFRPSSELGKLFATL